jgi:hypothetical protein
MPRDGTQDERGGGWLAREDERRERREERVDWWRSLTFFGRRHRGAVRE